jgi:hypothetical protein
VKGRTWLENLTFGKGAPDRARSLSGQEYERKLTPVTALTAIDCASIPVKRTCPLGNIREGQATESVTNARTA